jgi:cyclohexanecarboxyl-CoA dehydrogenase
MLLNEDQIALRDVARRFSREKLKPHYQAREADKGFDRGLMKEIGALGLIGVDLPEEYGGLGQSGVTSGLITGKWPTATSTSAICNCSGR